MARDLPIASTNSLGARRLATLAVVFIIVVSSVGLKWGLPYIWHPDEKVSLADDLIERRSLNPQYFINPSLHVYAVTGAVWLAERFVPGKMQFGTRAIVPLTALGDPNRPIQMTANLMARGLSVIFAAASVWWLWRGLRQEAGDWTAALAATALSVSMGLMNIAHFATPDACLVLATVCALGAFVRLSRTGALGDAILSGVGFGLACSTKYTGILLIAPLGWALLPVIGHRGLRRAALLAAAAVGTGVLTFFATTPYALLTWSSFVTDGLIFTWETGAPADSLIGVRRSWALYAVHLANAMSWPLFLLSLGGGLAWALGRRADPSRRAIGIHAVWIAAFWGFLGLSPHNALRFIMPIVPSLALFAGWACSRLWERRATFGSMRLGRGMATAILLYAAIYSGAGAYWFANDTRYAAGAWLRRHVRWDVNVIYFAIESYLPFFDRPRFGVTLRNDIYPYRAHDADFDQWRAETFAAMNDVIVDTSLFYQRFFDEPEKWPGRAKMYDELLRGTDPAGYRLAASFEPHAPWWLRPEPELVAPRIVVFAKAGQLRD